VEAGRLVGRLAGLHGRASVEGAVTVEWYDAMESIADEVRRLDSIHPAGSPPTYDGVRLGLAMMQDELVEALDAWRDERGLRRWVQTRAELVQVAAVAVRIIREMEP
jgi:hypothetical protein